MAEARLRHLEPIDVEEWPGVATVPNLAFSGARAKQAEFRFAKACSNAGLELVGNDPDLIIDQEELFSRLAASGWLGLAESYMAGEWRTDNLADVLTALLGSGYKPRGKLASAFTLPGQAVDTGGALPNELIRLSSGDGMSAFGGIFASGVPTTLRTAVKSYVAGAGRNREPASHFVDITKISEPVAVEREDLGEAQRRAASTLLDSAKVKAGSHVLEFPSSGGAVAILAARRQATVDALTADPAQVAGLQETFVLAGVEEDIHIQVLPQAIPTQREWGGAYDSIIAMEKLEVVGVHGSKRFIKAIDRLLATGGNAAFQSLVATDQWGQVSTEAISMLKAYIWPALQYPTVDEVHQLVDRDSSLRVVKETHFAGHYLKSVQLQKEIFEGQLREAAADGFDAVYRRMWVYHYALIEALLRLGCLNAVQFSLTTRNRRGRR
ncbi:SAM-dependent methyltransferase [Corynebacterium crudilactis]|uniref:Cyclopropane-fatty-acyl-phospholipid synthase n=1 Tax=Corynebacterium crudilactis TaxID=1652495 RepID=A0A172QTJ9_9CORY|nr:cyclopropane-fatty-acyl-phospholipid synthase family protein [Corynebacterium crudilactis]ANE03996.1 cyclopropane-fatty-acyl-phospholipid synthase [Corynebacterium crudilactis]